MFISAVAELVEHHRTGAINILATADTARSELLPDIPTLHEDGINIDAPGWFGFYAPAHTPQDILDRFAKAIVAATHISGVRAKIIAIGFEPTGTTAEELKQIQRAQFQHWGPIVKASGFKADE